METGKVLNPIPVQVPQPLGASLPNNDIKRLSDFFAILIKIDQRVNGVKKHDKPTN